MIDHILGRPSSSWKRTQVFLVVSFWIWRIARGDPRAPRFLGLRRLNKSLQRFTPWQIIVSTLTIIYASRNLDKILGLGAPEPLANLYSRSYYRATWIITGLDAGFATAMSIRPKWLRDFCSILFSAYYIVYANAADETLRRFRAVPTVELLRTTWEKTTNPYLRFILHLPSVPVRHKIHLARPRSSPYRRPITAYLFFAFPQEQLYKATDLIFDIPGGGFVAMSPEHHEERLRTWAIKTRRPIISLDYGKAPEYPYPFSIDEAFDLYRILVESAGRAIGMSGRKLNIIMSGDSAGAMLVVSVVIKILESGGKPTPSHPLGLEHAPAYPLPVALMLNYACLDFNLTSWMTPSNLRVLRSEASSGQLSCVRELRQSKDHLSHVSPLSMASAAPERRRSWKEAVITGFASGEVPRESSASTAASPLLRTRHSTSNVMGVTAYVRSPQDLMRRASGGGMGDEFAGVSGSESDDEYYDDDDENQADFAHLREQDRPVGARIKSLYSHSSLARRRAKFGAHRGAESGCGGMSVGGVPRTQSALERQQLELSQAVAEADLRARTGQARNSLGTRLTMTSRAGYFSDRIISPTMMRAMAILYIGPHRDPDFMTDYHLSPILAPSHLLAQFPPMYMQCGEKDPLVDDTVIFAGKVREAKRARKLELDELLAGVSDRRSPPSPRVGESLRMSAVSASGSSTLDGPRLAALRRERARLEREGEDDWVQMVLFSDWSHGYLQMTALMAEARAAVEELGELIADAFEKHGSRDVFGRRTSPPRGVSGVGGCEVRGAGTGAGAGRRRPMVAQQPDYYTTTQSETETDDVLTFVPRKTRRREGSEEVVPDFSTVRGGGGSAGNGGSGGVPGVGIVGAATGGKAGRTNSSGSETLRDDSSQEMLCVSSPEKVEGGNGVLRQLSPSMLPVKRLSPDPERALRLLSSLPSSRSGTPPSRGGGPNNNNKAGQTISEIELMRRRRMLDSHIFDSRGDVVLT